jgi:hypothetical protein
VTFPSVAVNDANNDDKEEKPKETEDQRRQREHTNTSSRDNWATGGGVAAVEKTPDGLMLLVSLKQSGSDTPLVVAFACPNGVCPDIIVGDAIEVDGEQGGSDLPGQKGWFIAESFEYVQKAPRPR